MTTQSKLRGTGIAAAPAGYIVGDQSLALTAAGTTQATALSIYSDTNVFTNVAASSGAILPPIGQGNRESGDEIEVFNYGANALLVYPPVGAAIGSGATNAGFSVAAGKGAKFRVIGPLQYSSLLSA
jgi:hypothetical protein